MKITTLFLEHIKSGPMQKDLDKWFTGESADLSPSTTQFLEKLDKKYHLPSLYSFTSLIKSAKEAGIRIVAIDSPISAVAGCHPDLPMDTEERNLGMNYTAKQIMDKEVKEGKYIVLTGANHGSKIRTLKGLAWISELMQCLLVIVSILHTAKNLLFISIPNHLAT